MNRYLCLFIMLLLTGGLYGQNNSNIQQLSLNEAILLGLKNSPAIRISSEKINASKGRFWSGISLPPPEVSVSYEFIPLSENLSSYGERTFEINQSFEFPSNYFLRGSILSKERAIAENELISTELKVASDIKRAYYTVLARNEQLKTAEEFLSITKEFYDKEEIGFKLGEGTNLERLTAKLQFTEAVNNVEVVKNQLAKAYSDLNLAMGYGNEINIKYQLTDSLENISISYVQEDLLGDAINSNPELKSGELRVSSSSVEKTLAWSGFLPAISVGYFRQKLDGDNNFYGASLGISIPLWFMFDNRGRIEESAANLSAAENELLLTKNEIFNKVNNAYTDFKNEQEQVQRYKTEILSLAEDIYNTAKINYDSGEITYTEFLPSKQVLISSKNNYINALLSYNLSIISLEEAVGKRLK